MVGHAMSSGRNTDKPNRVEGSALLPCSLKPLPSMDVGPMDVGPPIICQRLEFSARGERVGARVRIPLASNRICPLAIFIHDEPEDSENPALTGCLENGAAAIDLNWPLTGSRRSHKMSLQLLTVLGGPQEERKQSVLFRQFCAQAEEELACLLEAADRVPGVDASTIHRLDFSLAPRRAIAAENARELFASTGKTIHRHHGSPKKSVQRAGAHRALAEFLTALLA